MSLLLFLACGAAAPTISTVDPSTAKPGDTLKILGENFQDGATGAVGGQPMTVDFKGAISLEGTLPELAAGSHELVITNPDGQSASMAGAVTVPEAAEPLEICAGGYTAYSQFAGSRKLIKIDRHYKDQEEPERLEYTFDEVEAVEYEGRVQGEEYCSALLLRLKDGSRILFEDSKELNFKSKAQEMAQAMSKPVDVVHEDEVPAP
jgi:hypothetical protein